MTTVSDLGSDSLNWQFEFEGMQSIVCSWLQTLYAHCAHLTFVSDLHHELCLTCTRVVTRADGGCTKAAALTALRIRLAHSLH